VEQNGEICELWVKQQSNLTGKALVRTTYECHDFGVVRCDSFIHNIYAIRGGLTAGEILGRTQGNWLFAIFYEVFVLACLVHAPIGVANILRENFPHTQKLSALPWVLACLIFILGTTAVVGVFTGGDAI
jgi:fumarate reductase subunit C